MRLVPVVHGVRQIRRAALAVSSSQQLWSTSGMSARHMLPYVFPKDQRRYIVIYTKTDDKGRSSLYNGCVPLICCSKLQFVPKVCLIRPMRAMQLRTDGIVAYYLEQGTSAQGRRCI